MTNKREDSNFRDTPAALPTGSPVHPLPRILLRFVGAFLALLTSFSAPVRGKDTAGFVSGADISALATMERHGAIYRDAGRRGDAITILCAHGVDAFRLRLFVAPNGEGVVTNSLDYTLALAKRIRHAGGRFLLDLHYSDTWADPAKQFKPAAWNSLAFPDLVARVRSYTRDTLAAFVRAGVAPDYVQLGNEITNGMLWPDGRVDFAKPDDAEAWSRLGALMRAARAGFDDVFPADKRPQVIVHIESPNQLDRAVWFCDQATRAGVQFDIIGVSYYPDWHASVAELRQALNKLSATFDKPVMVVETAYPWKPDAHWKDRPHMDWPLTPAGQEQFLREVVAAVRAVPGGRGEGVWYWYPEAVLGTDLNVWVGGSCGLFDDRGNLLPAADALK